MKKLTFIGIITGLLLLCGISVSASTSSSVMDITETDVHRDVFGAQYTAPYSDKERAQESVSTMNGGLNITQVDLSLPGKNGLDVVLSRSYGNQNTKYVYAMGNYGYQTSTLGRAYLYQANGKSYRVLFSSEEEMLHFAPDYFYATSDLPTAGTSTNGVTFYRYTGFRKNTEAATTKYTRVKTEEGIGIRIKSEHGIESREGNTLGYKIGQGWQLNLPDMKHNYTKTRYNSKDEPVHETKYGILRDYRGNIWSYETYCALGSDDKWETGRDMYLENGSTHTSEIEGYFEDDTRDGKTENGINYNFVFTDTDGIKMYFKITGSLLNTSGKIQAIEDKYGNRITYTYGTDEAGKQKITITDTYGREIYVRFGSEGVSRIEYPDPETSEYRTISYTQNVTNDAQLDPSENLSVDNDYKLTVTDAQGNQTVYHSKKTQSMYYPYFSARGAGFYEGDTIWHCEAEDAYNLLDITYPTGLKSEYEYERWNYMFYGYNGGTRTRYNVTKRKDVSDGADKNVYTYAYYNTREGIPTASLPRDYTFCGVVTRQADQYQVVDTYNRLYNKVKVQTYLNGSYVNGRTGNPEQTTELGYDYEKKVVTWQTVKRGSYSQTKEWTYQTATKPKKIKDGDYEANITYDTTYNMPLTTTYQQDANTTILQENTLTADKKSIDTTTIKVNDVIKSKTKFTYDQYGNVTAKQMWESDSNGDGVLDENDETVTLKTDYTYNPNHTWSLHSYVENVQDADGNTEAQIGYTATYDVLGNLKTITDPNGNATTYTYDIMNRPIKATFADGTSRQLSYNIPANEVTYTDENGTQTKSMFDPLGQIEQVLLNDAGWKTLESYEFNNIGQQVKKTTMKNASDYTTEETTYNPDGTTAAVRVKNAAGETVTGADYTYAYTATGRSISAKTLNDPVTKVETYDLRDRKVKEEAQTTAKTLTTTYEYDYLTNIIAAKDARANANGWGNTTTATYDHMGNVLTQTNALGNTITNTYNLMGQLMSSGDYKGNTTTYVYDKMGRNIQVSTPFDSTNVSKKFVIYDKNGNVIREKSQNNAPGEGETYRSVEYVYNSKNQVTAVKQFDGGTEYKTAYTYDNAGRQTSLITGAATNAPHITSYTYNKLGQVVSETDPMGGVKTAAYDYLGNVTGGTTKAGETITNTYNDWNLPVMQTVASAMSDTNTIGIDMRSYTYDNLGRKISATNESGTATYEYDDFGHMTKETDVTGAVKEYTYDENGNRLTFTLTIDGTQQMDATYTYDKLNQLTGVTIGGDTTTYGYDENGNIVNKTTGQFVTTYAYNSGNLLTEMETNHPNRKYAVSGYTATYYLDGNVRERQDDGDWSSYTYDGLNRLIQDNGTEPLTYTYDAYGNIAQKSRNIMGPEYEITNYTYNANNQLLQSDEEYVNYMYNETGPLTITRYVYDANGNLTSKTPQILGEGSVNSGMSLSLIGEVTQEQLGLGYHMKVEQYAYNGFGQLTHAAVNDKLAEYAYNPDGLRVSKTVNGETTTHILDGVNVVADVTSENIFKYNRGRELISIEQDGRKGYYMFNGHGNVMQIVDENKDWWVSNWFTAYGGGSMSGEELNGFQNPFGYCGEYYDGETGQYYLRARYYDPNDGRFISEDTHWNTGNMIFGDNAGDNPVPSIFAIMQSGNLYGYCGNNPLSMIDPRGTDGETVDLGKNWYYRIDAEQPGVVRRHIHIWNTRTGESYAQNENGRPHDKNNNSKGNPPNSVNKKIKQKEGWDYKEKKKSFFDNATVRNMDNGVYIDYPDGSSVFYQQPWWEIGISREKKEQLYSYVPETYNAAPLVILPLTGGVIIPVWDGVPIPAFAW